MRARASVHGGGHHCPFPLACSERLVGCALRWVGPQGGVSFSSVGCETVRAELDRPRSKEEELPAGQGLGPDPAALASPGQADLAFPIQVRGLHVFAKSDELAP